MKVSKAETRERRRFKKRHGMRVTGKSVLVIQEVLIKRGKKRRK